MLTSGSGVVRPVVVATAVVIAAAVIITAAVIAAATALGLDLPGEQDTVRLHRVDLDREALVQAAEAGDSLEVGAAVDLDLEIAALGCDAEGARGSVLGDDRAVYVSNRGLGAGGKQRGCEGADGDRACQQGAFLRSGLICSSPWSRGSA